MNRLQAACRRALCLPIRAYQHTLSPWIGRSCRFTPSCSNYTMQAILTHGCIKGILLGAWRIARCNPLGKWGYDPVPPPGRWQSPARHLEPARRGESSPLACPLQFQLLVTHRTVGGVSYDKK